MTDTFKHTIVSFDSVSDAFAFRDAAENRHISGHLCPIPRQISAGCGIAWDSPVNWQEEIEHLLSDLNLSYDAVHNC